MAQGTKITEIVDVKAYEQLEKLQLELTKTRDLMISLTGEVVKTANATSKATPKEAIDNSQKLTKQTDLLVETRKKEIQQQNELIRAEAALNAATKQYAGSQKQLAAEIDYLIKKRDRLTNATEAERKESARLKDEIDKLNQKYKENASAAQAQQKNIGNYQSVWEGLTGTFAKVGMALGALGGVFAVVKSAMDTNNAASKEFAKVMGGMQSATEAVFRALGNMDFSNFISSVTKAFKAGYEYVGVLRQIQAENRGLSITEEKIKGQLLEQEKIWRDKSKTAEERRIASENMKELNVQLHTEKMVQIDKELKAELNKAAQETGITAKNIKYYMEEERYLASVGGKWNDKYNYIQALRNTEKEYFDQQSEKMIDNTKNWEKAQQELAKYTDTELRLADLGHKLNNLTKDRKDRISELIKSYYAEKNAITEREVAMLRMDNQIKKQATNEGNLAEKTEDAAEKQYIASNAYFFATHALEAQSGVTEQLITNWVEASNKMMNAAKSQEEMTAAMNDFWNATEKFENVTLPWEKASDKDVKDIADQAQKWDDFIEHLKTTSLEAGAEIANNLYGAQVDAKLQKLRDELDDWHNEQLNQLEERKNKGIISEKEYNRQKEQIETEYRRKQRAEKRREAELERDRALFQIAITTAVNVIKEWGNWYLMAAAAAAGIAEAAVVSSKPLPAYYKGVESSPEGFAKVGERGEELGISPDGKVWLTPATETIAYLEKGTKIIPHDKLMDIARGIGATPVTVGSYTDMNMAKIISEAYMRGTMDVVTAIRTQPRDSISITRGGWDHSTITATRRITRINKNIRK